MIALNRDKPSGGMKGAAEIPDARSIVSVAFVCARRGWPVFPCRPGTKEPATRHGFHDASTDPQRIRSWWRRMPGANLAIATGHPGPDVLDVDQHGAAGNGYAAFNRLWRAGVVGGASHIVVTPSGGFHVYFVGSEQPSGRLPHHHLDFKASGGYVLAPPSVVGGRPYVAVRSGCEAGELDWAAVVGLLDPAYGLRRHPPGRSFAHSGRLADWVERLGEGNRNAGLFWAACRAAEEGRVDLLDDLRAAALRTGLTKREISRTIASAQRAARPGLTRLESR